LPEKFTAHMKQNGWRVTRMSDAEVSRLGKQLYREMSGH
jgi:hypothetical protein